MKKIITMMLVLSMLTLAGCGKKEEKFDDLNPDAGSVTSVVSVSDIEELSEEPEVEEESPVDFDFMNGEEVNAEAIVAHAHELGVLENTWNNATEINPDDIINAYEEKNREKYESFAQDDQEYIVQIPEEDMDSVVTIFVDMPTDTLHQAEKYNETSKSYEFKYKVEATEESSGEESTEETEPEWPIKVSEIVTLSEDVYEIVLVDETNEETPVEFGTLTVENKDNVPKYISFAKPKPEEPVANTSTTMGSGTTPSAGTDDTTEGGTGKGNHSGLGSAWDNVDVPGDPNSATDTMVHVEWK